MASELVIFDLNDITESTNIEIVETSIVDSKLQILLQQFNLIEAYQPLIDCGFSFERLQYISQDDLNKIFPEKKYCGLVAELREKIFIWKTENFPDKFTTLSANSHVNKWIASNSGFQNSPESDSSTLCSLSVGDILKASNTGKTVLQFYADNTFLNKEYRKKLLSVLVEHFYVNNNTKLRTHELEKIADEIIATFPNENKDIYFLSRSETGKSNPSGILFNRFHNLNRKKIKLTETHLDNEKSSEDVVDSSENESVESARNKMRFMSGDECESLEIWASTFEYRRKYLKGSKSVSQMVDDWHFYAQATAYKFINFDFEKLFPLSENKLMDKWQELCSKLTIFYKSNVKEKTYRSLLESLSKDAVNENTKHCIIFMLLNAVLKPTSRHVIKVNGKKSVTKATIKDAINSSLMHIKSINDYERMKEERAKEYLAKKMSMQPYLIVVGTDINDLTDFYISYDRTLLKFHSFVGALDQCFKLFQVFHLKYPTDSTLPWLFFQQYVYNISSEFDIKNAVLTEFITNLNQ